MLDRRPARIFGPGDRDDVEAGRVIAAGRCDFEIRQRGLRHAPLLARVDRFGRMAGVGRAARFHFDEHDRAAVDGDDVELAQRRIVAALQDAVSPGA